MIDALDLITDVRCNMCGESETFINWHEHVDFDDLYQNYDMICCSDPVPEFFIVKLEPLLGTDEDKDYEIPGQGIWEYPVDEDLLEKLSEVTK